jgi:cobalamin biosynthesis Mg chelatase CobN
MIKKRLFLGQKSFIFRKISTIEGALIAVILKLGDTIMMKEKKMTRIGMALFLTTQLAAAPSFAIGQMGSNRSGIVTGTSGDTSANGSTSSGGATVNGGAASTDSAEVPAGVNNADNRMAQQEQRMADGDQMNISAVLWIALAIIVIGGVWYLARTSRRKV